MNYELAESYVLSLSAEGDKERGMPAEEVYAERAGRVAELKKALGYLAPLLGYGNGNAEGCARILREVVEKDEGKT